MDGMLENETLTRTYFLLAVSGTYQRWQDYGTRVLTEPRPFTGFVSDITWGYSIDEDFAHAYHFDKVGSSALDAKDFGPWWYKVHEQHWIEVTETTDTVRRVLPT